MVTKDGDGLKLFGMVNEFHKIKQSGQERTRCDKRIIVHFCSDEEAIVSLVSSYPPCPPLSLVISWNAGISLSRLERGWIECFTTREGAQTCLSAESCDAWRRAGNRGCLEFSATKIRSLRRSSVPRIERITSEGPKINLVSF